MEMDWTTRCLDVKRGVKIDGGITEELECGFFY